MNEEHNPEQHQTTSGQGTPRECPSFETLSLYFDEALDAADAARVDAHVAACGSCQSVLEDLRLIRQVLRATTPEASTRSFRLTADDVRDARPVLQPAALATSEPARRVTWLTLPFLPALTAVAALLLIAYYSIVPLPAFPVLLAPFIALLYVVIGLTVLVGRNLRPGNRAWMARAGELPEVD